MRCEECDGDGYIKIGPSCWKPASECCGGCYEEVECKQCNGTGDQDEEL